MQSEYPRPWTTLWVVLFGLFMILLDSTIVSVANPAIKVAFGADYSATVWVTTPTCWATRCRC